MPKKGFKAITVPEDLYMKINEVKRKFNEKSMAKVLERLVEMSKIYMLIEAFFNNTRKGTVQTFSLKDTVKNFQKSNENRYNFSNKRIINNELHGIFEKPGEGFEPPYSGSAVRRLTTWLPRRPTSS